MDNNIENSIFSFQFYKDESIPELSEEELRGKEYIGYSKDNLYPQFLLHLYSKCATHQSIIDGAVNYVMGEGLIINPINLANWAKKVNPDGETLRDIFRKAELDYQIFGGFALHIKLNRLKEISEITVLDFANCRTNQDETHVFYSKQWGKWGVKAVPYERFNQNNPKSDTIYYYKGKKTRGIYPVPLYDAGIKSIETDIKIDDFHLNNINTGFNASAIINFNDGRLENEEKKKKIQKKLEETFTGTDAKKMLVSFNDGQDRAVTIERLNSDDFDKKFETLQKNTQETIFTSHKVTSPALFGVKMEGTGFSKTEFKEAFDIYNNTVIKPLQDDLIGEFVKIFKPSYPDVSFEIIPFSLEEDVTVEQQLQKDRFLLDYFKVKDVNHFKEKYGVDLEFLTNQIPDEGYDFLKGQFARDRYDLNIKLEDK